MVRNYLEHMFNRSLACQIVECLFYMYYQKMRVSKESVAALCEALLVGARCSHDAVRCCKFGNRTAPDGPALRISTRITFRYLAAKVLCSVLKRKLLGRDRSHAGGRECCECIHTVRRRCAFGWLAFRGLFCDLHLILLECRADQEVAGSQFSEVVREVVKPGSESGLMVVYVLEYMLCAVLRIGPIIRAVCARLSSSPLR